MLFGDKIQSTALLRLANLMSSHLGKRRMQKQARSRRNPPRAGEAGNVFFTLFGAVAVVGVLGAGIMSTMRGPLTTMVEVNRIEETKAVLRLNSRLVLRNATNGDSADANPPTTRPASEYCDDDAFTEAPFPDSWAGAPTGGGSLPNNVGATMTDPWGTLYGYCAWNHGSDTSACTNTLPGNNGSTDVVIALISAGPDRAFNTTCADLFSGDANGDDIQMRIPYADAATIAGGGLTDGLWSIVDDGSGTNDVASIGEELQVTATGNSSFAGGATFGGNVSVDPGMSVSAPSVSTDIIVPFGGGTTVSVNANTLDVNANGDISGTLTVGGATTINNTLTVTGSNATTLGGLLTVGGNIESSGLVLTLDDNVDITGTLTGGSDNVLAIDDALDVTGGIDVSGDITDSSDNIVTINDGLSVTEASSFGGNVTITGDGDTNTDVLLEVLNDDGAGGTATTFEVLGDGETRLTATTSDGTTDAFTIDDALGAEIFAVDSNGTVSMAGGIADGTSGNILISNGTSFQSTAVAGTTDVTISTGGDLQIVAGAVDTNELADGAVTLNKIESISGDVLLGYLGVSGPPEVITLGTGLSITGTTLNVNTSSGGGDGVGSDGFTDLADTPGNYTGTTAGDLVVVNATTNGLEFVDAATIIPANDRIEDAPDTTAGNAVDTYIDVDTTDDGQTNSIIFVNNAVTTMSLTRQGTTAGAYAAIGGNPATSNISTYAHESVGTSSSGLSIKAGTGNGDANLYLVPTGTSTGNKASIMASMDNVSLTPMGALHFERDNGTGNPEARFVLDLFDGTTLNEYMHVTHDGIMAIGTPSPNASALLDVTSTTRGFLAPRVTTTQRNAIATPATGLLVFTTDAGDAGIFQFFDGTEWVDVGGGGAEVGGLWEADGTNDFIEYDDTLGGVRIGRVTGQPAPATDWLLDVTNSVVYTTTNKVGINSSTISTGLELDVTGNIGATNYCDQDGGDCFSAGDIATLAGGGAGKWDDADEAGDIKYNEADGDVLIGIDSSVAAGLNANATSDLYVAGQIIGNTTINATTSMTSPIFLAGDGAAATPSVRFTNDPDVGLYLAGTNILGFATNATQQMIIDANGDVGIGLAGTDALTKLDINGAIRIAEGIATCNALTEGAIRFVASSSSFQVCAEGATDWEVLFTGGSGAAGVWTDLGGGRIHYGDDGTQQVGIGTELPTSALDVLGDIRANSLRLNPISGDAPTYITDLALDDLNDVIAPTPNLDDVLTWDGSTWVPSPTSSGLWSESGSDIYFTSGNVGIGTAIPSVELDVDGDIQYTGTITDVSDIRLKSDIVPLDPADMINRISDIDTYSFLMKGAESRRFEYGVMAQELESIFPNLVHTADDEIGTKSVNYVGLIAPMVGAIQALRVEDAALYKRIDEHIKELAVENQSLKAQLQRLAEQTLMKHGELSLERDDLDVELLALEESVASLQEEVVAIGRKAGYASFSSINDIRIMLALIFSVAVGILLGYFAPRRHSALPD